MELARAVVAIIARSAWKLARMVLRKDRVLWSIFAVLALSTAITGRELVWLFLLGGLVAYLAKAMPRVTQLQAGMLIPVLATGTLVRSKILELLLFFTKAGAFVFGSGLAIVPFLYGGVVEQHHWLTDRQFLDAVAVAMITPGPVVITSGFVGYLVAGPWEQWLRLQACSFLFIWSFFSSVHSLAESRKIRWPGLSSKVSPLQRRVR